MIDRTYSEMKEYVKIVQIKKLKMKLTFSLDVQNLVGREMIFSIPALNLTRNIVFIYYFIFLYICIIASNNGNNQCMQFICPYLSDKN
jgi:hypothetical protein